MKRKSLKMKRPELMTKKERLLLIIFLAGVIGMAAGVLALVGRLIIT